MLDTSYCWRFGCKHYTGVVEFEDGLESSQKHTCEAFPDGIPEPITLGEEFHSEPIDGDHDIQFEVDPNLDLHARMLGDVE